MINAKTNHSTGTIGICTETDLLTIQVEIGEKQEFFLFLLLLKGDISYRKIHTASHGKVINLTILFSAELIID